MTQKILFNTDKNGTKYYHVTQTCEKCGGRGIIGYYIQINGGECFDCGGSGIVEYDEKEYTPEYEAKLIERREKSAAKKLEKAKLESAKKNAEFFKNNAFDEDGNTYFILGSTFEIKDELKAQGAKFDGNSRHWHIAVEPENRKFIKISVDEICHADAAGRYLWNDFKGVDAYETEYEYVTKIKEAEQSMKKIKEAEQSMKSSESASEWIGEEKDKLTLSVVYKNINFYHTQFGTTFIHTFEDESGNVIVWKTGVGRLFTDRNVNIGDTVTLTGTVKEHNEFRGIKQTVLTRCKIA